jgi:acyl-ACP thioesterase
MTEHTHFESFQIRASETDSSGDASLPALCDLLQEVAGNHAQKLNFDITDLFKKDLTWVLHRLHIRMNRYPAWREQIEIETWPSKGDALRAYRDFKIRDEKGEISGMCLSYWMMINLKNRRPVRMPQEVLDLGLRDDPHTIPVQSAKVHNESELAEKQLFRVRKSDLDMNNHVNNVAYIRWITDCIERGKVITELDIKFLMEVGIGEEVHCCWTENEGEYLFRIEAEGGNKVLALARCKVD